MAEWQRARLIPVSGIASEREAEMRATSALLAVIEAVRDLSLEMFGPLGATKAQRAEVRCYTEIPFKAGAGKAATRPDGLVQLTYGKSTWTALIEVKTGSATLNADQINAYWDLAREHDFDAVLTISNEIAPSKVAHPTDGLKVRANSPVKVHHISWAGIQSMCEVIKEHHGVDDPDQAWILGELIRYLRHPNSGANAFDDMGAEWITVRDAARDEALRRSDENVRAVAVRWEQLLRYAALRLEAEIGELVSQQLPAAQREPQARIKHLVESLVAKGHLDGALRIPHTVGDLELHVDLRARRISASVAVPAPEDRGGRARCTWLASQLGDNVDSRIVVEAYAKNARTPVAATLAEFREDKDCLLGEERREPYRFRVILTRDMGVARKTGRRSEGFIDSVLGLIADFYETVVQNITPWAPKAPKMTRAQVEKEPDSQPGRGEMLRIPPADDPDIDVQGPRLDGDPVTGDEAPSAGIDPDPWRRARQWPEV